MITGCEKLGKTKRVKRTAREIAIEKAEKLVKDSQSVLKQAKAMRMRINDLPVGDFSEIAIGFNNLIAESVTELSTLPFQVTSKPEEPEITETESVGFAHFMNPSETPSETENETE